MIMEDYCNRLCKHVIPARVRRDTSEPNLPWPAVLIKFGEGRCCPIVYTRNWEFL